MALSNLVWSSDARDRSWTLTSQQSEEHDTAIEPRVERYIREILTGLSGLFARPVGSDVGIGRESTSTIQPAIHRVAQLADLPEDWDSYGADSPSNEAIARAYEILFALDEDLGREFGAGIQPYAIAPVTDGGIQLEWRGPTAEIEVEIEPDGGLGYLFMDKRGPERSFVETSEATWPDVRARIASTLSRTS